MLSVHTTSLSLQNKSVNQSFELPCGFTCSEQSMSDQLRVSVYPFGVVPVLSGIILFACFSRQQESGKS